MHPGIWLPLRSCEVNTKCTDTLFSHRGIQSESKDVTETEIPYLNLHYWSTSLPPFWPFSVGTSGFPVSALTFPPPTSMFNYSPCGSKRRGRGVRRPKQTVGPRSNCGAVVRGKRTSPKLLSSVDERTQRDSETYRYKDQLKEVDPIELYSDEGHPHGSATGFL